ncbi:MAG: hypothetical protein H7263_01255 [Candidatus Sericytochromatia bacterium]|nr:hypothetical protein [Candidatus Sericytochromatia bacterium]
MSGDIRTSNPSGTSIYDSLSLKIDKPTPKAPTAVQEKPTQITSDQSQVEIPQGKQNAGNVDFVDKPETTKNTKSLPLIDEKSGDVLKFKTDAKGLPELNEKGQLQPDPKGNPVFIKVTNDDQPLPDKNGNLIFVESAGKIPASNVSLTDAPAPTKPADELPPLNETASADKSPQKDSGKVAPLCNPDTGEIYKLKVDKDGMPILNAKGELQPDPKGSPVFAKVDDKGAMIADANGKPEFVSAKGQPSPDTPEAIAKGMKAMNSHSAQRFMNGIGYKSMAKSGASFIANTLIKGVSVSVPFTEKIIGWGVKDAVVKAVGAELKVLKVAKAGTTTVIAATKLATTSATEGAIKLLTDAGRLGKGVETLTIKEAAKIAGGRVSAVKAGYDGIKAITKGFAEATTKEGVVAGSKIIGGVAKKTIIGASEQALKKGVTEGIETGFKAVTKKAGAKLAETVTTKATEKVLTTAATKAATEATAKGAGKIGSRFAGAIPVIGAVAGLAITAWDTHDAIKKQKDPNTTKLSKVLAWATVGLDGISTAADATGIGAPVGWVASGLSIATSVGSDLTQHWHWNKKK